MAYNAHNGFLASYETGILNHAEHLEPLFREREILRGVSTMLSIGIGAGNLECELVRRHGISLSYIERSPPMIEAVRKNIEHHGIGESVDDVFVGSFEDIRIDTIYDLILSLDSWYHMGRNLPALEKALRLRAEGGRLLIQLMSQDRQLYWILDQVRGLMCSNDLSTWAREKGFDHDYFECSRWIPTSRLIPNEQPTEAFKHFVAFAKGQSWDQLPDNERHEAIQAVNSLQRDGAIETRHGYLLFER